MEKLLLKRGEAMELLGVGDWVMRDLVRRGELTKRYVRFEGGEPVGKAVYLRREVEALRKKIEEGRDENGCD